MCSLNVRKLISLQIPFKIYFSLCKFGQTQNVKELVKFPSSHQPNMNSFIHEPSFVINRENILILLLVEELEADKWKVIFVKICQHSSRIVKCASKNNQISSVAIP